MVQVNMQPCPAVDGTFSAKAEKRPDTYCTKACFTPSTSIKIFSKTISLRPKIHKTEYVCLNDIYNFCTLYFPKFCVSKDINAKNRDFYRFLMGFRMEIKFAGIFIPV